MEVKIPKEIRNYTEEIFFGLTLRQFIFSVLACGAAIMLYFILRPHFGIETLSWICILGAVPFASLGFISYHGMTAEKLLIAVIRSKLLIPVKLKAKPSNLYYELLKEDINKWRKEGYVNAENSAEKGQLKDTV